MNSTESAETLRARLEEFLRTCREPAALEPGEDAFPLGAGHFTLETRGPRLVLEVWDERRNLARRVLRVKEARPGRLELAVERFGGREGAMFLLDLARGRAQEAPRRSARLVFREQFRRFLTRQFAGWKVLELSAEANLQESLSPVFPRALLKQGAAGWAAMACPAEAAAAQAVLTFALVWLDHLRQRYPRLAVEGLVLYLPHGHERTTCLRLPFLDAAAFQPSVFVYSKEGYADRLEPRDWGNLDTRLEPRPGGAAGRPARLEAWLERLSRLEHVESVPLGDAVSLRVRGIEFARVTPTALLFGLERRAPAGERHLAEIERLAAELARLRRFDAADRDNPLYRQQPEAWLESQVRAQLERLDPNLLPAPVYGQVPAMAGGERGIIDLLAAGRDGRLAVLELKASEDIHFPLQTLDYWMRVKWHLDRGEFTQLGYFPGLALRPEPPRLLLVAPALDFHPKTEVILRFFAPQIEVERIGLAAGWRAQLEVMFRLRGAERPVVL
jgi:hypothetical protein